VVTSLDSFGRQQGKRSVLIDLASEASIEAVLAAPMASIQSKMARMASTIARLDNRVANLEKIREINSPPTSTATALQQTFQMFEHDFQKDDFLTTVTSNSSKHRKNPQFHLKPMAELQVEVPASIQEQRVYMKSVDIVIAYCSKKDKAREFEWIRERFAKQLPADRYYVANVTVYSKCCTGKGNYMKSSLLESLKSIANEMHFDVTVYCIHNFGNEAYAYLMHMALYYGKYADYTGFFHDHGPFLQHDADCAFARCTWRYFMSLLDRPPHHVGFGFHHQNRTVADYTYQQAEDGRCRDSPKTHLARKDITNDEFPDSIGKIEDECAMVVQQRPNVDGSCVDGRPSDFGIYGGEFITSRENLESNNHFFYSQQTDCWLRALGRASLDGQKRKFAVGHALGVLLESTWHRVVGLPHVPIPNFVQGYFEGMKEMCSRLNFSRAGQLINFNEIDVYGSSAKDLPPMGGRPFCYSEDDRIPAPRFNKEGQKLSPRLRGL
jgi:hypothetical protein